ncbi:MAG: hypothetical protein GY869_01260 [Planctomycetes bacterium]|nr:hypothetical protein [Planctomycetota bacterium]
MSTRDFITRREKPTKLIIISILFSVLLWAVIVLLPLASLYFGALMPVDIEESVGINVILVLRSFGWAGVIGIVAVVLGYIPGRVLGTAGKGQGVLLFLFLLPLLLPRYVLYYAWRLLQTPTSDLGRYLASNPERANLVGDLTIVMVMIFWYWPLASLLIGQGWRNIDREALDCARLEAPPERRFLSVTLPLMRHSLLLAFFVCFVFALGEFGTFHLAGVRTLTMSLNDMFGLTNSPSTVARAAWPLVLVAVVMGIFLWRRIHDWTVNVQGVAAAGPGWWRVAAVGVLLVLSLAAPVGLLIGCVREAEPFARFWRLHSDEIAGSLLTSGGAAVIALVMAGGALSMERFGGVGKLVSALMQITIFTAMFLPGSLVAVALLKMFGESWLFAELREGWYMVSVGLAARFTGVVLILLRFGRDSQQRHLAEMAAVDGASCFQAWRYIHWPRLGPMWIGAAVLVVMLGMTELPATTMLLPAGVPNFAQQLLNQMHYMRDQQVIASCLMLMGVYMVLAGATVGLVRVFQGRSMTVLFLTLFLVSMAGCDFSGSSGGDVKVVKVIGETGRGGGQFIYPRAIDMADDGSMFVVDKTGRIQHLDSEGGYLSSIIMPEIEQGYSTGISCGADGNLYVADTHYHRVMVFTQTGEKIGEFGQLGEGDGEFIYPTDVAFGDDGRVFVSEYGGHDRISVFEKLVSGDNSGAEKQWQFIFSFGSLGSDVGELSRPSALCVDLERARLYVADAVNHRIALYNFDGELQEYWCSVGMEPGELRYPYDLALTDDGNLVVCEYGNNRVQMFDAKGKSLAVYGRAGRQWGELAHPWGVAVDGKKRVYVVDGGNNRVQVWKL